MIVIIPIALAAGSASALMFASTKSGMPIALLLALLAPLPLMVAALVWGPLCATIGGIAAAAGFELFFGIRYCIAFTITVALPAWWLGHLALLGRPQPSSPAPDSPSQAAVQMEWYPIGRILLWIVGFATLSSAISWLAFDKGDQAIAQALRNALSTFSTRDRVLTGAEIEQLVAALMTIVRWMSAMFVVYTLALNLWLAAKVSTVSGRMQRPWPDLTSVTLPPMTLVALCVALAICFTGGTLGILAQIVTAALMTAYALVGLAVLHIVTLGSTSRTFWLGCAYLLLGLLPWSVIFAIALGLADAALGIRQRYLRRRPPPLPAA